MWGHALIPHEHNHDLLHKTHSEHHHHHDEDNNGNDDSPWQQAFANFLHGADVNSYFGNPQSSFVFIQKIVKDCIYPEVFDKFPSNSILFQKPEFPPGNTAAYQSIDFPSYSLRGPPRFIV